MPPTSWSSRVRVQIGSAEHDPEWTRKLLGILADLLRKNQLPKSGREYLAAELEKIARGGDPRALLPPRRKRKKYSSDDVLVAVEREKMKRGQKRADRYIYDSVGRQFGIRGSTAAKEASISLSSIRRTARQMLDNGRRMGRYYGMAIWRLRGLPPDHVMELVFGRASLPPDHVMDLLFGPLLEK